LNFEIPMTATDLRNLTAALTQAGLNPNSAAALDYIRKHSGTATATDIATHLGTSRTSPTNIIDALERLGYAKRTKSPDRRKNPVRILPKGTAILKELGIE
jgi:DNA-binding MarR family transcriptional regulator